MVVEIERATGDLVPFRSLPPPLNTAIRTAKGPETLTFLWRYGREARGTAFLDVEESGRGKIQFVFAAQEIQDDRRFGAAAVLVGQDGKPLHTFLARANLTGGVFPDGTRRHRVSLEVERPPDWWRNVAAIAFLNMTYYPLQNLDDEGVWQAMRKSVGNLTKGQGSEQRR
jgi:hypothetical protein